MGKYEFLFGVLITLLCVSCTELRVKKYQNLIEPNLGNAKKPEMDKLLGNPIFCKQESRYEKCEYRTALGQNSQVPSIMRREQGLGPDLSPYDYFDVLHLYYDAFHTLREWEPVVLGQ